MPNSDQKMSGSVAAGTSSSARLQRGVTLVEFLVVLAIIGLLLALLLPAVQAARVRARDATCKNNLNQLNVAMVQLCEATRELPPPVRPDQVGGWTIEVLPFIEQGNLHERLVVGSPLASADPVLRRPPAVFRCPERTVRDGTPDDVMWPGHYVLVTDKGRETVTLFDAPIDVAAPWASGPELGIEQIRRSVGPHKGAFFYASGHQQGVDRMLGGQRVVR